MEKDQGRGPGRDHQSDHADGERRVGDVGNTFAGDQTVILWTDTGFFNAINPHVDVLNGSHTIAAPVAFQRHTTITVAPASVFDCVRNFLLIIGRG